MLALGTLLIVACGGGDGSSPDAKSAELTLDPAGGEYSLTNGVILRIPEGAVTEPTRITLRELPGEQVNTILSTQANLFHAKRYLGGFSVEPDVEFNVPITAIVPLLPLEPGEIPVQMEIDFAGEKYWISETNLTYWADQGVAEVEIAHFSDPIVGAIDGIDPSKLDELCTDPLWNPLLAICEDFDELQPAYCLLAPEDRPTGAVCCREQVIDVRAQAAEFSLNRDSLECEIVFDNVQVTFLDCTLPDGSPASPQSSALGEVSPHCPQGTTFEIDVQPSTINMFACDLAPLKATITATAPDGTILFDHVGFPPEWEPSTPDIVTISIDGMVEGKAEGTTRVLAKISETSTIPPGEALVNVRSNIRSFSVSPPAVTLEGEEERILQARAVDADGNLLDASQVAWSSGDPSVAALLLDTGEITSVGGVSRGATEVTATFEYECETATSSAAVTVNCPPLTFSVDPSQVMLAVGEERFLEAVAFDEDLNPLDVSGVQWSSGDPSIASVLLDTGPITSVGGVSKGGPVAVVATYEDDCQTKTASALVTVECPLLSFFVTPAAITLQVGEERLLEAEALDRDLNPLDVSGVQWTSGDPSIAALLLDTGPITSVGGVSEGGAVTVTATYTDDCETAQASAQITVTPGPLTVEISMPSDVCFAKGETLRLEATIRDAEGNEKPPQQPITWRSLGEGVATVDTDGLVTALEGGLVTIEASYEEDDEVYIGSTLIQVLDLNGAWDGTEVANETACDEGINTYRRTVVVTHSGDTVGFGWSGGSASGTKSGCTIGGYFGESEDGGTTYGGGSLSIFPAAPSMSGSVSWTWNGTDPVTGEPISCSGSSQLTARR
jgi:uncharacterized protein YjdB